MANISMQRIGEINAGGAAGQGNDAAPWGKAEHLVGIHFQFCMFKEFFRTVGILQYFKQALQPAVLSAVAGSDILFVLPMSRNPQFRHSMHHGSPDLNLYAAVFRPDNRRMQGLIIVRFRG